MFVYPNIPFKLEISTIIPYTILCCHTIMYLDCWQRSWFILNWKWQVLWCRVYFYCWFLLDIISGSHLPLCVTGWLFYALDSCCYVTHFSSLRVLEVYVQCANKDIGLETVKPYQTSGFRIWSCKSKNNFTLPASQKKNLSFKLQEFALHTKFWSFTDYLWITDFIPHYKLCAKQVQLKSK